MPETRPFPFAFRIRVPTKVPRRLHTFPNIVKILWFCGLYTCYFMLDSLDVKEWPGSDATFWPAEVLVKFQQGRGRVRDAG